MSMQHLCVFDLQIIVMPLLCQPFHMQYLDAIVFPIDVYAVYNLYSVDLPSLSMIVMI